MEMMQHKIFSLSGTILFSLWAVGLALANNGHAYGHVNHFAAPELDGGLIRSGAAVLIGCNVLRSRGCVGAAANEPRFVHIILLRLVIS
jgi:hypothetical protein